MRKGIRTTLRLSAGVSVIWAVCMFVLCLFSEKRLHRMKMQLQESAAQLAEERDTFEDEISTLKELREVKLGLKNELRSLRKQIAKEKGISKENGDQGDESELKLAEARHAFMRQNKVLLRRISEARHILITCKTSPCLEALEDEHRDKLQRAHEDWRATVQALLNAATRGETDRVRQLQERVRQLADFADISTGNTQLYFHQAEKIMEASDNILDAVNMRKKLRIPSGETGVSRDSAQTQTY